MRRVVELLGPGNHGYTLAELIRAVGSDHALEARLRMPPYDPLPKEPVRFDFRMRAS